ncbi:MAG: hypothetical protein ACI8W3_001089 [Myxococcota bacterium]|jgi:hypothetical protein
MTFALIQYRFTDPLRGKVTGPPAHYESSESLDGNIDVDRVKHLQVESKARKSGSTIGRTEKAKAKSALREVIGTIC